MKTFEEWDQEIGTHKTGKYNKKIDMYTRRDGSNERVICVRWSTRQDKYHFGVEHKALFEFSPQGFEQAIKFADTVEDNL